jgi:hypothetical protein
MLGQMRPNESSIHSGGGGNVQECSLFGAR